MTDLISDEEGLRELFDYNPETGVFIWKKSTAQRIKVGDRAGWRNSQGYMLLFFKSQQIMQHRVAWLLVHGRWPVGRIDHINGQRDDNRISNLREATVAQNAWNSRIFRNNKSGFKGVFRCKGADRWQASIRIGGVQKHLGLFKTPEEAHAAYCAAAHEHRGEFARTK